MLNNHHHYYSCEAADWLCRECETVTDYCVGGYNEEDAVTVSLSPGEADVLRFILGVVLSDDFESEADAAHYRALCARFDA